MKTRRCISPMANAGTDVPGRTWAAHKAKRAGCWLIASGSLCMLAGSAGAQAWGSPQAWTMVGGDARHSATALQVPGSLTIPAWVRSTDSQGRTITWVGQSGPVVFEGRVLAIGSVTSGSTTYSLYALDRESGAVLWATPIPAIVAGSWSSPAIDRRNRSVIVGSGTSLRAFDLVSGAQRWQATLTRSVVNASPVVSEDMPGKNRAFITDYDGVGTEGRLYCVNVDARSAANPFDPGQIVWSVAIGATSGNTPAYLGRRVYVASVGDWTFAPGQVLCFPGDATTTPAPVWSVDNPKGESFFGAVSVARDGRGMLAVYAASYAFYGGTTSANLLKIEANSGAVQWSVDANRTSAAPVVLGDGRVVLSTGLNGYGSVPAIQVFRDLQSSATLVWDSSLATWVDANANGLRDQGEFTSVGGWSNQIALGRMDGRLTALAGVMPTNANSTGSCTMLRAIDLEGQTPVILPMNSSQAGSTPALVDGNVYSIGPGGLAAFGPLPPRYDVDQNGVVNLDDLHAWHQGAGARDVNRDGAVNASDGAALEEELAREGRG